MKKNKEKKVKYTHLNRDKRLRMETMLSNGAKVTEIASYIGVNRSTVYREMKRGKYTHRNSDWTEETRYSCDLAQDKYEKHLKGKGPDFKIGKNVKLAELIEETIIKKKYSPEAALAYIRINFPEIYKDGICIGTLYSYIDKGLFLKLTNKHLPVKRNKKRKYSKIRIQKRTQAGTSIEKRPKEIDTRDEFGHWEMDSVIGKKGVSKRRFIVLTERKTRYEIVRLVESGEAVKVVEVVDQLEKDFGSSFRTIFKTITVDNGSEFADVLGLETSIDKMNKRVDLYYCHPNCSWERGTNEVTNKLIRRFIPKGTNFDGIGKKKVAEIQEWINDYPRRMFGWVSAKKMYTQELERAG